MSGLSKQRLGQLLVLAGKVSRPQLAEAVESQVEFGDRLGSALVRLGHLSEAELTNFLASQQGVGQAEALEIDPDLADLLPEEFVKRWEVVPVKVEGRTLTIACASPADLDLIDEVRFRTGYPSVKAVVAPERVLRRVIKDFYAVVTTYEEVLESAGPELFAEALLKEPNANKEGEHRNDVFQLEMDAGKPPIVSLVNWMLLEGLKRGASDIHVEPFEAFLRVRMRIDGVLHTVLTPPHRLHKAMISRIKIVAHMDISKNRMPLDGHIGVMYEGDVVHFRVNTLPTVYGEKCVIRLMKKDAALLDIAKMGIPERILTPFRKEIGSPQGLVLVTGPTGSGKTATVHAALDAVNDINVNITTIEDPFESAVPGVIHVQIDKKSGLDFVAAMRSILRQDPDILFLGEIRDLEVAKIAMEAAMTGHMVFSTLHTNSSVESLVRLEEMGVDTFLIAGTLRAILAQRLVRRICSECAEPTDPPLEDLAALKLEHLSDGLFMTGRGCNRCMHTGLRGRAGVYECLIVSPEIRALIREKVSVEVIEEAARAEGFRAMIEHGMELVAAGVTTVAEIRRVISE